MTSSPQRNPPMSYDAFKMLSLKEQRELIQSHIDDVRKICGEFLFNTITSSGIPQKYRLKIYERVLFDDVGDINSFIDGEIKKYVSLEKAVEVHQN